MQTFTHFFKANKLKMLVLCIVAFSAMSFRLMVTMPLPPADYTGSPGDAQDCGSCHTPGYNNGIAIVSITSNIPSWGYTPGSTYSVTASIARSLGIMFQFELSPQNASTGTYLGTLHNVAGNTSLVGTKDIAGDPSTLNNPGGQSWTFTWTAPAVSTGPVTFYAAFNDADPNTSIDTIYTRTYTVPENPVSVNETDEIANSVSVYPNPTSGEFQMQVGNGQSALGNEYKIEIYNVYGDKVYEQDISDKETANGNSPYGLSLITVNLSESPDGIYFVRINTSAGIISKKVLVLR